MFQKIFSKVRMWFLRKYKFLKEEQLHQTVLSFILTLTFITVGGLWFNSHFQNRQDLRQREYEFYRFQLEKKDETMAFVSENINLRYLNSVRVLYSPNSEDVWKRYTDSVTEWNITLEQMRQKMATYYGWELTSKLIDEGSDSLSDTPKTIHYKFTKLHTYLIAIRNGDFSKLKKAQQLQQEIVNQKDEVLTSMIENLKANNESLK
ncbi:MAG: hypothetical protein KBB54_01290 [Candidatus Pacebacteria bacterium]|nr:hypothetical protein [Candidatus Paceibacterota bacterium]